MSENMPKVKDMQDAKTTCRSRRKGGKSWDPRSAAAGLVLEYGIATLFGKQTTERRDGLGPSMGDAVSKALVEREEVQEHLRLSGEFPIPEGAQ